MDTPTIMLVDDDRNLCRGLERLLHRQGYETFSASSGTEAVRKAAENKPAVAVIDVGLPDIDGYHVCREIRTICKPWKVRTVMLTGWTQPIDKLRGFAFGADAYLTKPCSHLELMDTIRMLMEPWVED